MTRLLTKHIATMTEMREPHKVLERSNGEPVAILKNSALVGYLVPESAVSQEEHTYVSEEDILSHIAETQAEVQPVLDYLKDK